MSRTVRSLAALALVVAIPATAWGVRFHNHLVKSAPLTGETVAAPKTITLWFAEKPELPASTIALLAADSSTIATGKLSAPAGETNAIATTVDKALAAGTYTVQWKTAGSDGHPARGKYSFTVK